jgi:hypothetical protein
MKILELEKIGKKATYKVNGAADSIKTLVVIPAVGGLTAGQRVVVHQAKQGGAYRLEAGDLVIRVAPNDSN